MRLNEQSMLLAIAVASTVLPTPGTSSIRMCPRARRQQITRSTAARLPRKTRAMLSRSLAIGSGIGRFDAERRLTSASGVGRGGSIVWRLRPAEGRATSGSGMSDEQGHEPRGAEGLLSRPGPESERAVDLARELGGDLPCAACRYNLRGLSVRSVCPECGTPVRATILFTVDPYASVLRPITWPRATAAGLILWSMGALGAAVLTWVLRGAD